MSEEGFGESTWTIDLCYILERFRIKFKYTTITIGVDPGYCKEAFYNKVIAKDYDRVNRRFQEAESRGMKIVETSITFAEILSHLQTAGPIIILTNANLLRCSRCSNYTSCYPSCFKNISYQVSSNRIFLYLMFEFFNFKNCKNKRVFLTFLSGSLRAGGWVWSSVSRDSLQKSQFERQDLLHVARDVWGG